MLKVVRNTFFIALALFVFGCGQQNPSNSNTQQLSTDVIITFADFAESAQRYERLIADFNEQQTDVEVQFVPISSREYQLGNYVAYLDELVTKGDTFVVNAAQLAGNYGRFLDLWPLMNGDERFAADDFWPGVLNGCATSDQAFGLPINFGFSMIFYNRRAFLDGGMDPPELDWTWDDFILAAERLTRQEANETVQFGFTNTQNSGLLFYPLLAPNDSVNLSPDVAQLETFLNEYRALHMGQSVPMPDGSKQVWEQQEEMENLVLQGKAAMWTDWQGLQNGRQFSLGALADVQMAPFPAMGRNSNTTPVSVVLCGVASAGTANPLAAWEWLQFLSMHLNDDEYGRIPARRSLAENSPLWQSQVQPDTPLGYALHHAYYPPATFDKTVVDTHITQAILGELTVADLLAELEIAPPVVEAVPQATPVSVATAAPPLSQDMAVIHYFADFRTHGDAARVQSLADQFNASQSRIRVMVGSNVRAASSFGLETVAAQYDCFSWTPLTRGDVAHVYDLEPLLAAETAVSLPMSEYDERLRNQFADNGVLYAIPAGIIPTIVVLNATHLEQIGAALPDAAWTVDDLRAFAEDVSIAADERPVYGFTPLQGEEGSIGLLLANGNIQPYTITDNILQVAYDTPEILAALNQLVNLAARQAIFPAYDIGSQSLYRDNWDRRHQLIITGQVAMWTNIAGLEEEVSFERLTLPLPQDIAHFSPPISTGYYISGRVDNPSACWAWIAFLAEQETAVIGVPARDSTAQSSAWKNSVGSREAAVYLTSLTRQLNNALTLETIQLTVPLQSWWNDVLAAAYAGEDIAGLLPEAQRKGEIFAACINTAAAKDAVTVTGCAQEADPAYKTFEELAQELGRG